MSDDVLFDDGAVRITSTQASFGSRTYSVDDIKEVEGYYQRSRLVWFGVALAMLGVLVLLWKTAILDYDTGGLYQFLSLIPVPLIGVGGALFVFASKYAIRLHTSTGPVEVLAVRNRAYAQKVADVLTAAVRRRAANPKAPTPANKRKR